MYSTYSSQYVSDYVNTVTCVEGDWNIDEAGNMLQRTLFAIRCHPCADHLIHVFDWLSRFINQYKKHFTAKHEIFFFPIVGSA